jgi:acyl-CoA thioesterase
MAGCVVFMFAAAFSDFLMLYKLYSRVGNLVAVTCQEGVVRANVRGPTENKANL